MESTILYEAFRRSRNIPLLGMVASIGLRLQAIAWRQRPELTIRLSNFLPIGGACLVAQFAVMITCKIWGVEENRANILSTEVAVYMSFMLNRAVTWRDRIPTTRALWSTPVHFVIYNAVLPMPWIMILGFGGLIALGWPWWVSWAVTQLLVCVVNFLVSDRLSFGHIVQKLYK